MTSNLPGRDTRMWSCQGDGVVASVEGDDTRAAGLKSSGSPACTQESVSDNWATRTLLLLGGIDESRIAKMATAIPMGYCMKCKAQREIKDPEQITMKNGRPATQGTCPGSSTKIFKIGAAK